MEKQSPKYLTPEEYLALEEAAEFRSEYYRGKMSPREGESLNHNRIVGNLIANLHYALKNKNCQVFAIDLRLWIKARDMFTYPDVLVVCGKAEFYPGRDDTVANPVVIFEVLSESTKNYDRGEKFEIYRAIPTLKEYILVDQYRLHLEHFSKNGQGKWVLEEFEDLNAMLNLPEIEFQISLKEIYDKVEL
ncbi:MAG: Uma2 family endonuclease [Calditrichaceae bacterium]|nr:Uma2 family endonuclease [Calditrichia bacterium]NUQ42004.1 Uma2 family endonuclease [Calditrichaceae bacterium]